MVRESNHSNKVFIERFLSVANFKYIVLGFKFRKTKIRYDDSFEFLNTLLVNVTF